MGYGAGYALPPIITSTIDVRAFSDVAAAAVNSLIKTANRDPIWGVKAGGSVTCAALVHEGTLYFGAHDGILYALDPLTGKERWRFPTNGPIAGGEFPVIWQDSLLFTSFDHHLYCLARDGALRWKFDAKSKLAATPVVHDGRAYFGSKEGRIFCVDIATGSQRWSFSAQDAVWGPALADGVLYFASWDKHLYALTLDGRLLWKYPSPEQFNWVPAVGRFIYVGGRDNCLSAITPDGKLAWKFRTSGAVVSVPAVAGDRVFFGSFDHNFYCVHAVTGALLWKLQTNDISFARPLVHEGRVFFPSSDRHLYAATLDGSLVWKFKADGELFTPAIWNDLLFVGSWDCHLYALDWRTGALRWKFATSSATPSEIDIDQAFAEQTAFTVFHAAPEPARESRYERAPLGEEPAGAVYNARSEYAGRSQYASKNPNKYAK